MAEFFDTGESRTLPWARCPQAAALVAQLADPDRGWDAVANDRVTPIWAVRNPEKLRSWTATD